MCHVDFCLKTRVKNIFNHSYITGPGAQPGWTGFSGRWPGGAVCVPRHRAGEGQGAQDSETGPVLSGNLLTRALDNHPCYWDHLIHFLWDPRCCQCGFSLAFLPPHSSNNDSSTDTLFFIVVTMKH